MKRVCIVGCGAISGNHAAALQKTDEANLVAVCDINRERADKLAEKYNVKVYYDYAEVLADDSIDSVHICTPHYLHTDMAIAALEKGKFVFLEKPVAISTEQLDRLIEVEKKHPGKLAVCFQNRTNPCVVTLKKEMENLEENGAFKGSKAVLTWHRTAEYYAMDAWRGKWETEGGGLLINQAVHTLDLLCYLSGDANAVMGTMATKVLSDCIEVEDTAEAVIFLKNGMRSCFYGTNAYSTDSCYNVEINFEKTTYRYADNFLYKIKKGERPEIIADDQMQAEGKSYWGDGHSRIISIFYEKGNAGMSLAEAEPTFRLLFAFYESAFKKGEKVEF